MTDIVYRHCIELACICTAALVYTVLHLAIYYTARLLSGREQGVIRQLLQGVWVVGCFVVAMLVANNGTIMYYHILVYILILICIFKLGKLIYKLMQKSRKY